MHDIGWQETGWEWVGQQDVRRDEGWRRCSGVMAPVTLSCPLAPALLQSRVPVDRQNVSAVVPLYLYVACKRLPPGQTRAKHLREHLSTLPGADV